MRHVQNEIEKIVYLQLEPIRQFAASVEQAERTLVGITQEIWDTQEELDSWKLQKMRDKYARIEKFPERVQERYWEIKNQLNLQGGSDIRNLIMEICDNEDSILSRDQRDGLRFRWESLDLRYRSLQKSLHRARKSLNIALWNSDSAARVIDPKANREELWFQYRNEAKELLSPSFIDDAGIQSIQPRALAIQMDNCVRSVWALTQQYDDFMDEMAEEYNLLQDPVLNQQLRDTRPFLSWELALNTTIEELRRSAIDLWVLLLQNGKPADGIWKLRDRISETRLSLLRIRPEFNIIFDQFRFLHWEYLKLQHTNKDSENIETDRQRRMNRPFLLNEKLDSTEPVVPRSVERELCSYRLKQRMAQVHALGGSKGWIANPLVWEMLELDLSLRDEGGIQNETTPRLIFILLRARILTSQTLKKFKSKASLLRLSSQLTQVSRDVGNNVKQEVHWNRYFILLKFLFDQIDGINKFILAIKEQKDLDWIADETRTLASDVMESAIKSRKLHLKLWNTLVDVNLSMQGVDGLNHYHTENTKSILSWIQTQGPATTALDVWRTASTDNMDDLSFTTKTRFGNESRTSRPGTLLLQRDLESNAAHWDYTQYKNPNGERVKVHYCSSRESTERVIEKYFASEKVLGFDMEWKANASSADSVKDNVSLIQIASEKRVGLFQIARFEKDESLNNLVPPALKRLMESPEILKAGVNIKADCTRLRKHLGIDSKGLFELSYLHKIVKFSSDNPTMVNKKPVKLSDQVEEHFGLPLWKGDVRSSDWTKKLEGEQILCK
jgi:hypothetical protein